MIHELARYCDGILKHNHVLSRWLGVLDVMIEKGRGNEINKRRIIQTIEADLQLLMSTYLGIRIEENYENDKRMSKHNYGSR